MASPRATAAVLVTSDTCARDSSKDTSGTYVCNKLTQSKLFRTIERTIVEDDREKITSCLEGLLGRQDMALIITVGGTGLCPRDVTPDATSALYDKPCGGISTALHFASLKHSPHAALSRLTAGIRGQCLIVNFPGKLKACQECFACLEEFLEHAIEQVRFDPKAIAETHRRQQQATASKSPVATPSSTELLVGQFSLADDADAKRTKSNKDDSGESPQQPTSTAATDLLVPSNDTKVAPVQTSPSSHSDKLRSPAKSTCDVTSKSTSTKALAQQSPYPLIGYYEALEILNTLSYNLLRTKKNVNLLSLDQAHCILGDVLAIDYKSAECLPLYSASTMDGYVVNIPPKLKNMIAHMTTITATLVANVKTLEEHQSTQSSTFVCYQVNTGGRLPKNDFVIVPTEKAEKVTANQVRMHELRVGSYIRSAGSDINTDDSIKAGTIIGPVELSLLASMGHQVVTVFNKPRLGLLSNGDELVEFYSPKSLNPNSVVDTNSILLSSLFKLRGFQIESFGITRDEPDEILLKITESLKKCDILIVTGGASMGTRDHVKDVIELVGGTIHFGRVNMKPGKPASFSSLASDDKQKFIFSLPGNPVSAYITSLVLVIPFIEYGMRNHFSVEAVTTIDCIGDLIKVEIGKLIDEDQSYEFDGRLEFVRAKFTTRTRASALDSPYLVTVSYKQQSSRVLNLQDCDCLIMIDPSSKGSKFLVGQTYQALKLRKY